MFMIIRYTTAGCDLGRVVLVATDRGVCGVALADTDAELLAFVRSDFPDDTEERDDAGLADRLAALLDNFTADTPRPLPLDVRGTAFQHRVWAELRRIPRGRTRTYKELAARIGDPKAVRALARACATNPVSVVIPCHRVIGSDGRLTGYRWGLARKQALLEREGAAALAGRP
jgi:AraC family transcriptional regulator of adaptative response/methylated-DNA-[protein]-cysteine methyltransferase